ELRLAVVLHNGSASDPYGHYFEPRPAEMEHVFQPDGKSWLMSLLAFHPWFFLRELERPSQEQQADGSAPRNPFTARSPGGKVRQASSGADALALNALVQQLNRGRSALDNDPEAPRFTWAHVALFGPEEALDERNANSGLLRRYGSLMAHSLDL